MRTKTRYRTRAERTELLTTLLHKCFKKLQSLTRLAETCFFAFINVSYSQNSNWERKVVILRGLSLVSWRSDHLLESAQAATPIQEPSSLSAKDTMRRSSYVGTQAKEQKGQRSFRYIPSMTDIAVLAQLSSAQPRSRRQPRTHTRG